MAFNRKCSTLHYNNNMLNLLQKGSGVCLKKRY